MRKPIRAALYARVSTRNGQQDPEVQLQALREVAERAGWQIVGTYVDHGISGAKGRDKRPGLHDVLTDATKRKFKLLAVWSTDRLGRSLSDLLETLKTLNAVGCDLYIHTQAIDTSTPGGKALFQMLGVFAEFEREVISERVRAGLDKAKANNKQLGRPRFGNEHDKKMKKLRKKLISRIHELAAEGVAQREIGKRLDVPESTVRKVLDPWLAPKIGELAGEGMDARAIAQKLNLKEERVNRLLLLQSS